MGSKGYRRSARAGGSLPLVARRRHLQGQWDAAGAGRRPDRASPYDRDVRPRKRVQVRDGVAHPDRRVLDFIREQGEPAARGEDILERVIGILAAGEPPESRSPEANEPTNPLRGLP